ILVYPFTGTGGVAVKNSDLQRLDPGEFLNDVVIEVALKLWLDDLRRDNPGLAEQIHVFSSYFFTNLSKKNPEEGYEKVRKWTARFDIFQKKYIIVPINEK
ncbi:hypothetical protein BU17DRAFT_7919, partial [Hysterangium stoloniferum]